jgi:hypothetical protein
VATVCGTLATLDIKRTTPSEPLAEGMWFCGLDARRDRTL